MKEYITLLKPCRFTKSKITVWTSHRNRQLLIHSGDKYVMCLGSLGIQRGPKPCALMEFAFCLMGSPAGQFSIDETLLEI